MTRPSLERRSLMLRASASLPLLCLVMTLIACNPDPNIERESTYHSPVFAVDGVYKSMQGPIGSVEFDVGAGAELQRGPELVWLRGFRSVVVDERAEKQLPQYFMCHTNLVYRGLAAHRKIFGGGSPTSQVAREKIFTISQGEEHVRFPEGFGIPVVSNLPGRSFGVYNQMLNVNHTDARPNRKDNIKLRYQNTVYYVRESERRRPVKPLYQALGQIMVALNTDNAVYNMPVPTGVHARASCGNGKAASPLRFTDDYGQEFSYHWKLPPGREVRSTVISGSMLNLKYDTTIHYIMAHMHPYGESLALKDLTEDRIIFESKMTGYADHIGLEKVEHYESAEGIPVYRDHKYALISTYNNTTNETHDAMAIMYFFLHDKDFAMPAKAQLEAARTFPPPQDGNAHAHGSM